MATELPTSDAAGNEVMIYFVPVMADTSTLAGQSAKNTGELLIKTTDGKDVERIDKGHYVVVSSGVELFSDDPAAP